MNTQVSYAYGIIPLKKIDNEWYTYLIQHVNAFWGFPKGHPESGETPQQCALRELYEETRLRVVRFLSDVQFKEEFTFEKEGQQVFKRCLYFVAEVAGEAEVGVDADQEIIAGTWILLHDAQKLLTYETGKKLCQKVCAFVQEDCIRNGSQ